ncbi:MAG: glycosyltransferase family 4 protein [Clostridiales Family XIII bacterium]|jgi:glycosyltransferase involved in cell wall biosynthesis|nr:glycosyltransferase family 4 protein [Clostridiales Family XIII bacterium]
MKILIVRTSAIGVSSQLINTYNSQEIGLAKALNKKGCTCDVVFFGGKKNSVSDIWFDEGKSFKVYYIGGIDILDYGFFIGLNALAERYDVIQSAEYNQIETWRLARRFPGKVLVYHGPYHCDFNKGYYLRTKVADFLCLKTYIQNNTPFITKSKLATEFLQSKGISRIYTMGVGLDLEQLHGAYTANNTVCEFISMIADLDTRKLLYIGKLEPRRNILFLLDIFSHIRDREPDISLVIIGGGEVDYVKQCFDYAEKAGVCDSIFYVDKMEQSQLKDVYCACDVFLLPTIYDIFGMVLLEAMYFGIPVVTTRNGGSDILITNGENGIVIDSFDCDEWVDAIWELLHNQSKRELISTNANKTVREEFTWDVMAEKFIDIYASLA